jgi:hypothetical protein
VFGYGDGGFSGWSRCKRRLDALAPISGWTLHDIRRAVATGMGEIGISPFVIEGVLNHATGHRTGIAAVYNRSQYKKETRSALNKWNIHVLKTIKQARPPRKSGAAA